MSAGDQDRESWKRAAALAAVDYVEDGMVVGLGTGSTATFAVARLGDRVREGLRIVGIPTSERTHRQALDEGIPIGTFAEHPRIDVTIDGADEIAQASLDLVKGHGGALLREKIVAAASTRMLVVADASKLVGRLGSTMTVPIEIVPFGWEVTVGRLRERSEDVKLRLDDRGPYLTDGGHYIVDCRFPPIENAGALERDLKGLVGVVETGLFIGMAAEAFVADADGVRQIKPR